MTFDTWIDTFTIEKQLNQDHTFEVQGNFGTNMIPLACVIDAIKSASAAEKSQIKKTIIKIDFCNGNVMHFFQHLAGAIAI